MLRSSLGLARKTSRSSAYCSTSSACSAASPASTEDENESHVGRLPLVHSSSFASSPSACAVFSSRTANWNQSRPFSTAVLKFSSSLPRHELPNQAILTQQQRRHHSQLTAAAAGFQNPLSFYNIPTHDHPRQRHYQHQHQQIRTKVFVSKFNDMNITSNQILDYCAHRGILNLDKARVTSTHVILQECPFCHPTNGKPDNMYKCYVQIGNGLYFCHRCGNKGSWFDFKSTLRGYEDTVVSVAGNAAPSAGGGGGGHRSPGRPAHPNSGRQQPPKKGPVAPLPLPKPRLQACYNSNLLPKPAEALPDSSGFPAATETNSITSDTSATGEENNPKSSCKVLKYLQETRGFELRTLCKYGVGKAIYQFPSEKNGQYVSTECITFPWLMKVKDIQEQEALRGAEFPVRAKTERGAEGATDILNETMDEDVFVTRRIKVRALEQKSWQRLDPAGGGWGLFGFHTIPDDATEVVLTEGEYDAMAVWQATGRPAISLPNGCRSLPMEVLPMLERFQKIYLWMDNDGPGQEGAKNFAQKIGKNRCYIVQPPGNEPNEYPKDANDALQKGMDLEVMIKEAAVTKHENVVNFESMRQDVIHEILHPNEYTGVKMPSLPALTNIIKGYRRGELTVLTGPTGRYVSCPFYFMFSCIEIGEIVLDGCHQNFLMVSHEYHSLHILPSNIVARPLFLGSCHWTWPSKTSTCYGAVSKSKTLV